MFGHASAPTKVYRYGAHAPTHGLDVIEEQLRLAHRYRNALVALEHTRRAAVHAVLTRAMPTGAAWEATEALLMALKESVRTRVAAQHAARRRRVISPDAKAHLEDLQLALKECYAHRKALKAAALAQPRVKAAFAEVTAQTVAEGKRLRATCGLAWGTYLMVEQGMQAAHRGPPPRFHRWDGSGQVAVQLQQGLSVEALQAMRDRRLQLPAPGPSRQPNGTVRSRPDQLVTCRFRIGSVGREPLWAEIPVRLHRPLPEGASVKWAYLQRQRVATHWRWRLLLVVSHPDGFPHHDAAPTGVVGIDPGYRVRPHGLRVAYWVGSDGAQGELVIPQERLDDWARVERMQARRTEAFNWIRGALMVWRETHEPPAWWPESMATLAQWRSPARLASLTRLWRTAHADEHPAILAELEWWRRWEKLHYEEQEHLRRKCLDWRETTYRTWIAGVRRRYRTAVVEKADWADLARRPPPETITDIPEPVRRYRMIAAPARLLQVVREGMAETLDAPAAYSTRRCAACGRVMAGVDTAALYMRCPGCGTRWDQDQNAATNFARVADALRERLRAGART